MTAGREVLCLLVLLVVLPLSLEQGLCRFGGCDMESVGCHTAVWFVNNSGTELHIELEAKVDGDWLGIAFSNTPSMENSDLITGYIKNTQAVVEDRFVMSSGVIPVDADQNVLLGSNGMSGNAFTRITFTRRVVSNDTKDVSLDSPLYVLLVRGQSLSDSSIEYTWMNVTSEPVNVTECLFCGVQPCQNNGSCEDMDGVYGCVCPKYFTGPLCEIFSCDPDIVCFGHGICNPKFVPGKPPDDVYNSVCLCEDGYSGFDCKVDINECVLEGGNEACGLFPCLDKVGKYECDYCFQNKCKNGATCDPVNAMATKEVTCNCTTAYGGTLCNIEQCVDPIVTCSNHGICNRDRDPSKPAHESANPLCLCYGYTGLHCEIFIDFCTSNPPNGKAKCALANETCYAKVNRFECGKPCESNPCMNGGTCVVRGNEIGFDCHCPTGTTGVQCETDTHEPNTMMSRHATTSMVTDVTPTTQSITGPSSVAEKGLCSPGKSCNGNGICNPEYAYHSNPVAQFLCVCNAEYTGTQCETRIVHLELHQPSVTTPYFAVSMATSDSLESSSNGNRIAAGLAAGLSISLVVCTMLVLSGIFIWKRRMRMRKSYMKIDTVSHELTEANYFPSETAYANIHTTSTRL